MAGSERFAPLRRSGRALVALLLGVLLTVGYFALPSGQTSASEDDSSASEVAGEAARLEITGVSPTEPTPGSAVVLRFSGVALGVPLQAFAGKRELAVLVQRAQSVVVALPADQPSGHLKLRLASGAERSRAYHVVVRGRDLRRQIGRASRRERVYHPV